MTQRTLPEPVRRCIGVPAGTTIEVPVELVTARDVFTAELRLFRSGWTIIDHAGRLPPGTGYIRADVAIWSVIVTRDAGWVLHALGNRCPHAGYPVCIAEQQSGDRLTCPYHGWSFELDGRFAARPEPETETETEVPGLPTYRVATVGGLLLVELSRATGTQAMPPPGWPGDLFAAPDLLMNANERGRDRLRTELNWKLVRQFLLRSPSVLLSLLARPQSGYGTLSVIDPVFGSKENSSIPAAADGAVCLAAGPINLIVAFRGAVTLLRLIPLAPNRTDIVVIQLHTAAGSVEPAANGWLDELTAALDRVVERDASALALLDAPFLAAYGSLMEADVVRQHEAGTSPAGYRRF